jgi:hypothetical protein
VHHLWNLIMAFDSSIAIASGIMFPYIYFTLVLKFRSPWIMRI